MNNTLTRHLSTIRLMNNSRMISCLHYAIFTNYGWHEIADYEAFPLPIATYVI